MSLPRVSIITPAYNAAPYLGATARTVLAQSYVDWEWLIVDDGSTDGTAEIAAALEDPRVRLIRASHSGLPAVGRNIGIGAACGDYVALLDADDLWEPDKLAEQMAYVAVHPEVGLVFSRFYLWVDSHKRPREVLPDTCGLPNPGWMLPLLVLKNRIGTSSAVIRRDLIVKAGGFDEDVRQRATEDYELWLRLAALAPFGYVDRPLSWYRIHSTNISDRQLSLMSGHVLALEKTFRRQPELYDQPELSAARMTARKLRWLGSGRLLDGVDDCGWHDLLQSLKIWPADSETWKLFALSFLGARGIKVLRRISRLLH